MYKYHQPWWIEFKEISIFANKVWQLIFLFHIKLTTECQSVKTMQFTRIICITQVKMVVYKFLGILGKTKHQVKKSQKQVLLHVKCSEVFRTVTKYSSTMLSWNFRIFFFCFFLQKQKPEMLNIYFCLSEASCESVMS